MNDLSEQQQILNDAKILNPDISDAIISEVTVFLNSDSNKTELSPVAQKQWSERLLSKLVVTKKGDEN